ncbi:hypothetical protein ZIOFF_025725 [Zingiber officinale]|uniref:Uncharacterized protein n=1 Tax=Zingiber officinale TaxID=94328 RepID=A0A8J5GUK0_ZINOF|nr:hypothetical protein ZIOFF_025725 [Zingiber officinale]
MVETQIPLWIDIVYLTDLFLQLENGSSASSDIDIDPMHAGLDQWNSDNQVEEDRDWEEAIWEGNRSVDITGVAQAQYADDFADFKESKFRITYIGNPEDYVDARGFDELLEQLAEADSSRRGSIGCSYKSKGASLQPPIPSFLHLAMVKVRNSCLICRHELPTDDPEYEEGTEEAHDFNDARNEPGSVEEHRRVPTQSRGGGNGVCWLFLAAVPIICIIRIILASLLKKPTGDVQIPSNVREQHPITVGTNRSSFLNFMKMKKGTTELEEWEFEELKVENLGTHNREFEETKFNIVDGVKY